MKQIIDYIINIKDSQKAKPEIMLKLSEVSEKEKQFLNSLSKEKMKEYLNFVSQQSILQTMELDNVIELTYKFCKEIFLG